MGLRAAVYGSQLKYCRFISEAVSKVLWGQIIFTSTCRRRNKFIKLSPYRTSGADLIWTSLTRVSEINFKTH